MEMLPNGSIVNELPLGKNNQKLIHKRILIN